MLNLFYVTLESSTAAYFILDMKARGIFYVTYGSFTVAYFILDMKDRGIFYVTYGSSTVAYFILNNIMTFHDILYYILKSHRNIVYIK